MGEVASLARVRGRKPEELGVRSDCPRDGAAEEIGLGYSDLVDFLLVLRGGALRQMEPQLAGVLEGLVDDQCVLAGDFVCLESEQALLQRIGVGANAPPPVLEILELR